jgi:putative nucleotidyltransferase with HDIG domain
MALLHEWVENEGLRKHMYAVEAAVRFYARKMGADEEVWGLAGLLHDLDWEKNPDVHPMKGVEALKEGGYPEEVIHAVLAHRPEYTGVQPETDLDRVLSVVKKLKDRSFAAGVDREQVATGVELIGLERSEHIQNVIEGMRDVADVLGVRGQDIKKG